MDKINRNTHNEDELYPENPDMENEQSEQSDDNEPDMDFSEEYTEEQLSEEYTESENQEENDAEEINNYNEDDFDDAFENYYDDESDKVKKKRDRKGKPQIKKRRVSVGTVILRVILLAIVGLIIFFGVKGVRYLMESSSFNSVKKAQTKEISITTTGTLAYAGYQKGVLVANNGMINYYNSGGDELWSAEGFDGSPVIDVNGRYALITYTNTPNAVLLSGSEGKNVTGTGNITTACVNKNGYFALVMTEEGYKNQIVVFDNYGEVIYRWHSAENYVTSVAISPDNKKMTIATVGIGDSLIESSVLMFDFNQNKPHAGQQQDGNLIMDLEYSGRNRIVAIGDKNTTYYKSNGSKVNEIDYQGKKLTTFDVCEDGHTILCFAQDDAATSNSDVYSYNSKGKQIGHYETQGRVFAISSSDRHILVAREREFDLLSEKCKKRVTRSVVKDIKNSILFDGYDYAFAVSGNTAQIINVK